MKRGKHEKLSGKGIEKVEREGKVVVETMRSKKNRREIGLYL